MGQTYHIVAPESILVPPATNFVTDHLKSFGQKGRRAVPPSHHRAAHSWQRSGNPIQRNKIPLLRLAKGEVRVVSVCEPRRRVRSSLFTGSSRGLCCCERHRKVWRTEKGKALSGKHCDAFLYCEAPLPPAPAARHRRCPPYCRVITFPAENEIRCATKTDDPPLTSATEALASKIATGPFCLVLFMKASHIFCLSAVDFQHAPVPVSIVRHISRAT